MKTELIPFSALCSAHSGSDEQGLSTTPKSQKHFGLRDWPQLLRVAVVPLGWEEE